MKCIFCAIAQKEIASSIIYEDEHVIAFPDANPVPNAKHHLLFIPKEHIRGFIGNNYSLMLMSAINKYLSMNTVKNAKVVMRDGKEAGQEIFHLHAHLIMNFF